ncbi:MAG TPA: DUF6527 family protein [Terriglobia bacterium]|nr:DUF6527 family protein [Terriglobia bacterium]
MKRRTEITHEFVEYMPDDLQEGFVYVSVQFATALHKCCCGCGSQVVTPLSPADWKLIFDGETISLDPSIGNWSFPCQSHYWIKRDKVVWARQWSRREIERGRSDDLSAREAYFNIKSHLTDNDSAATKMESMPKKSLWGQLKGWWAKPRD